MRAGVRAILTVAIIGAVVVGLWWYLHPFQSSCCDEPVAVPGVEVPARPADAFPMTVASVWDGDTLRATPQAPNDAMPTADEVRVRLIGIDTPELGDPSECGAEDARTHLATLAPEGSTLWAAFDVDPQDRYERYLLYLWTDDGRFINHELVAAGDAEAMAVEPNHAYATLFTSTEAAARAQDVGQWGVCG
ncbi:thermonuclease family protein [Microbacterium sp. SS28]|uniref:thermonuclease family protein n=1 Tax=Microbacterium sp. SS28 TaxID=2919948 RepID=UPI001FAA92BB|nr:thermonuclease family protein [Microbacterium sp. SS28]